MITKQEINKAFELVENLNDKLFNKFEGESYHSFSLSYNGIDVIILFDDIILYNSDEDEREFNEDKNEYEDLELFLMRKIHEYYQEIIMCYNAITTANIFPGAINL